MGYRPRGRVHARHFFLLVIIFSILAVGIQSSALSVSAAPAQTVSGDEIDRLQLQHHLDYRAPLYSATWVGTHNSFNSIEDGYNTGAPSLANHTASLENQLKAGARALAWDLADPTFDSGNDIYQCHQVCGVGDKELSFAVGVVKDWLALPANADEVIMIVLEESGGFTEDLDRTSAVTYFSATGFEDKIYGPSDYSGTGGSFRELPIQDLTKQIIRDAGKNILLVCFNDCDGPSSWNNMVWDFPFTQDVLRREHILSLIAEDRASVPTYNPIDGPTFRTKLEQGAAMLGLDYMVDVNRHNDLIWSWKPN
ncbi:MAG: hypothetical protein ACE5Q6_01860, partial [Dehalococcoidia bacterium]